MQTPVHYTFKLSVTAGGTIVGSLTGDGNIMRMAFSNTGIGDTCELGGMEFVNILGSAVTHTGAETAEHLVYYLV